MHWIREASRTQPWFQPADGDPVMVEVDQLLAKGAKQGELSARDRKRLFSLATSAGVSLDVAMRERMFNQRLEDYGPK